MRTALALLFVFTGSAMASLIETVNPDTSATWPVGSSFEAGEVAVTTDPLGPFAGNAVQFRGYTAGGSTIPRITGDTCAAVGCLVFSYGLTFSAPSTISSITFVGDAFNGATFELLDAGSAVIDSLSESSGNHGSPVTYTMPTLGASGTSFTLALYDNSTYWTYVSDIAVNSPGAAPEPATYGSLLMGMGALLLYRRRWQRS